MSVCSRPSNQVSPAIRYGTSRLWELFSSRASNNNDDEITTTTVTAQPQSRESPLGDANCTLHIRHIRSLANSVGLYPSRSQINEMVQCACRLAGREPADHVTFGEFSVFITELEELYRRQTALRPSSSAAVRRPRSQLKAKAIRDLEQRRLQRRYSSHGDKFQVFLGGSCNPTTWRNDVAIPFLKQHGITYYNPQVSSWRPELIEIEDIAKQAAEILLFVIDSQTRSIASMVEAAYLSGCGRQLLLVIKPLESTVNVAGENLQQGEVNDLRHSHAFLTDMVERMSIPVFNDIKVALECTRRAVKNNIDVSNLTVNDGAQPVKHPYLRIANELMRIKDVFSSTDTKGTGELSLNDVQLAYKAIAGYQLPYDLLVSRVNSKTLTFEDFCCLLSEYRYTYQTKNFMQRLAGGFCTLPRNISCWLRTRSDDVDKISTDLRPRDVFLGGSCGTTRWRDDIAIPILLKHAISYYNPHMTEGWNESFISHEAAMKDVCRLLLFVITGDTRGITSMLEAAHFIGQGCNVVVCIQNMKDGVRVGQETLTDIAIKDYNRARAYLADIANRDGMPVFEDIQEAVMCSVQRLHGSPS